MGFLCSDRYRFALGLALALAGLAPCWAWSDGFHIRPHPQNVTTDGVTLIWESTEEGVGVVEFGPHDAVDRRASEDGPKKIHRVRLTGLAPDTTYAYRVQAGDDTHEARFTTAPGHDRAITFAVLGDSRRWGTAWADTNMGEHMMQWRPEFVVNMGDLVGSGHQYEQWPEHFERFGDLNKSIMMVTARGNHEGSRKRDAENDWFAKYHELPGAGEPLVAFDWGNTHFVLISFEDARDVLGQLDEDLAQNSKKYVVVAFHYPVYCSGYFSPVDSRKEESSGAMAHVRNVLDKHHVTVHFAGHTHIYERVFPIYEGRRDPRGTTYIVQGGDIGGNYPEWWTAYQDDPGAMDQPTYTLVTTRDDRMEIRTFVWSPPDKQIVQIDRVIIGYDEAVPTALAASLPELKGNALLDAIQDLGAMMYAPAAGALSRYLEHDDPAVRRAAATALRGIGAEAGAKELVKYLDAPDLHVRREVARSFESAMPRGLAKAVAKAALDAGQDARVRVALIGALQLHTPAKRTRDVAIEILSGEAPVDVRNRAAYALGRVADKGDVEDLVRLFKKEPSSFATIRLAHTLNALTRVRIGLDGDGELAQSKPGEREPFAEKWLSKP